MLPSLGCCSEGHLRAVVFKLSALDWRGLLLLGPQAPSSREGNGVLHCPPAQSASADSAWMHHRLLLALQCESAQLIM